MKRKLTVLLLALLLTGCSLARPEAGGETEDRFAGFYVVYDASGTGRGGYEDSPNLVEYGSETVNTEYGKFSVPKKRLVAKEKDGQYDFGLKGRSLFLIHGEDPAAFTAVVSDMAGSQANIHVKDDETVNSLSGTIYFGPPLGAGPDWDPYLQSGVTIFFRVYEAPDGVIYLDGGGNSSNGVGTYSERHTFSSTADGKTTSETTEVQVALEELPRLEKLVVSQFDESDALLRADDLALREVLPEVECLPEAAWVLVEEQSADGTVRTVYNVPEEEPVSHTIVLLDDDGWGYTAELKIAKSGAIDKSPDTAV